MWVNDRKKLLLQNFVLKVSNESEHSNVNEFYHLGKVSDEEILRLPTYTYSKSTESQHVSPMKKSTSFSKDNNKMAI